MNKISKGFIRYPLLLCFVLFPLVSWAQAKSVWVKPLQQCWVFESDGMTSLKVASDNDKTIILPTSEGQLLGIDLDTGRKIWKTTVGNDIDSEIIVEGPNILLASSKIETNSAMITSRSLLSINSNSGIASIVIPDETSSPAENIFVISDGKFVFVVERDGKVRAVDTIEKKILWQRNLNFRVVTEPRISNSRLYLGTSNRSIVVLSTDTGNILNQVPLGKIPSQLAVSENTLYVGDTLGGIRALKQGVQKDFWITKAGGEISEITPYEDLILVSSNDNYEYAILKETGKKVWKRKLAGRILGKTIIDGKISVLFTHGSNTALFIDLENGSIVNRIILPKNKYFVSGPISLNNKLIVPSNTGLIAYSPAKCSP